MKAMNVSVPRALLWQNIRKVKSYLVVGTPKWWSSSIQVLF